MFAHATLANDFVFPFAFLPFDNPVLKVEDPFTLLLEAASQFELQFPAGATKIAAFREHVKQYRDTRGKVADRTVVFENYKSRLENVSSTNQSLYESFGELLREFTNQDPLPQRCLCWIRSKRWSIATRSNFWA